MGVAAEEEVAAAEAVVPLRVVEAAVRVAAVEAPDHRYHDLKRVSHVREAVVRVLTVQRAARTSARRKVVLAPVARQRDQVVG